MDCMQTEKKTERARQKKIAGMAIGHLLVLAVALTAIFSGRYLFNLTPEMLSGAESLQTNLFHIRLCAFCVIFLGMLMLLRDLLEWHDQKAEQGDTEKTSGEAPGMC